MNYTCITCIINDSVMRMDEKKPSASLFRRVKKIQMSKFRNTELKSDSDSDSEPDSEVERKFDAELMAKLKSDSGSE